MNLHDWIDELCDVLDLDLEVDESLVLDVAREAAHNVERPAAPISTFLLGYAAGRGDADPDELDRLATATVALARRWDKSAYDVAHEDDDPEADGEAGGEAGGETTVAGDLEDVDA
ncbi:MAG: DUF6457 domain-containing protein [Marmoricola sp.]